MSEKKHELILVFAALIVSCFFLIYEVLDSPKYSKTEAVEIVTSSFFTEETEPDKAGKVNINTASIEELCTLEEVGEKKAAAIIKFREENGEFRTVEEIMLVEGISTETFNKNIERLTV